MGVELTGLEQEQLDVVPTRAARQRVEEDVVALRLATVLIVPFGRISLTALLLVSATNTSPAASTATSAGLLNPEAAGRGDGLFRVAPWQPRRSPLLYGNTSTTMSVKRERRLSLVKKRSQPPSTAAAKCNESPSLKLKVARIVVARSNTAVVIGKN